MKTELTPEQITEMGKKWFDLVFSTLPAEEVMSKYSPEDRLKGLSPEDILKGLTSEDILKGLSLEEIELYLKKIRKKTQ